MCPRLAVALGATWHFGLERTETWPDDSLGQVCIALLGNALFVAFRDMLSPCFALERCRNSVADTRAGRRATFA